MWKKKRWGATHILLDNTSLVLKLQTNFSSTYKSQSPK